MKQLYEYAILLQEKRDKDGEVTEEAKVLVEPTTVLASDESQATVIAGRAIPEDQMDRLERITLAVRPF